MKNDIKVKSRLINFSQHPLQSSIYLFIQSVYPSYLLHYLLLVQVILRIVSPFVILLSSSPLIFVHTWLEVLDLRVVISHRKIFSIHSSVLIIISQRSTAMLISVLIWIERITTTKMHLFSLLVILLGKVRICVSVGWLLNTLLESRSRIPPWSRDNPFLILITMSRLLNRYLMFIPSVISLMIKRNPPIDRCSSWDRKFPSMLIIATKEIGIFRRNRTDIILKPFFVIFEHSNYQLMK